MSDAKIHPLGGGPTRCTTLPTDSAGRKTYPIATGFLDYFPDAIAELSRVSHAATAQHHPGAEKPYWERGKSNDQDDTCMRHFLQRGTRDTDGQRHTAKAAWRLIAILQLEIEAEREGK